MFEEHLTWKRTANHYLKNWNYCYLSYGLLPSYFNCYLDVLNINTTCGYELRQSARPKIRLPSTRLIFTESYLLYQLIKLINCTQTNNPKILEKIMKRHTLILDSTSLSQGYTYLHIPMNAPCRFALNVDFCRYSAIIIIVLN